MARAANDKTNAPEEADVRNAVLHIEDHHAALMSERGVYMQKCKKIRDSMAVDYEQAADKGIPKKLLKSIVKERELERRIAGLTDEMEYDEQREREMLIEKLGEFANTPLGAAAVAKHDGKATLAQAGA
jgi:hypothetical protein